MRSTPDNNFNCCTALGKSLTVVPAVTLIQRLPPGSKVSSRISMLLDSVQWEPTQNITSNFYMRIEIVLNFRKISPMVKITQREHKNSVLRIYSAINSDVLSMASLGREHFYNGLHRMCHFSGCHFSVETPVNWVETFAINSQPSLIFITIFPSFGRF